MAQSEAQRKWYSENTICVNVRFSRNQDPEMFELLTKAENKSGVIRDLIQKGLEASKPDAVISRAFTEHQK